MPSKDNLLGKVPVVRILDNLPEVEEHLRPQILREINDRQWSCVRDVVIEAKYKAEELLRNDEVFKDPGKVAFYLGFAAYADYTLASLELLRRKPTEVHPGPEPGPET